MPYTIRPIKSVAVIGAGIIGLACAMELADRGLAVSLYDPNWPPRGASWAAAGMLAPAFEAAASPGVHPCLFQLCDTSAQLWPAWARALEKKSGRPSGYQSGPSLAIALNDSQVQHLEGAARAMRHHLARPEPCNDALAKIEPAIQTEVRAAWSLPSDGQVDNRLTLAALMQCVEHHPNITIRKEAASLRGGKNEIDHAGLDATLVCAGWRTPIVKVDAQGRSVDLFNWDSRLHDIRTYGGQMLSLSRVEGAPNITVRCGDLYIVPKADRIIVGATTEPGRILSSAEPEIIAQLRRRAIEICPALAAAEILETWAGVRPGTRDHAPILGETRTPNLFVASGHFRNGILLAPISAQILADLIVDTVQSDLARAFAPTSHLTERV
jgi:glycine oxidase